MVAVLAAVLDMDNLFLAPVRGPRRYQEGYLRLSSLLRPGVAALREATLGLVLAVMGFPAV